LAARLDCSISLTVTFLTDPSGFFWTPVTPTTFLPTLTSSGGTVPLRFQPYRNAGQVSTLTLHSHGGNVVPVNETRHEEPAMIANASDFRIIARHGDIAVAEKLVGPVKFHGSRGFTVIKMSGNTMVMDLAHRLTEAAARRKANDIWIKEPHLRSRYTATA
jgi:hypothetical protein